MTTTAKVRIALPSKGRMEGETTEFLANCGMKIKKPNPRQYSASMPAFPNVEVLFQRPRDIPASVAAGEVDLGITGHDTLAEVESNPEHPDNIVMIHDKLGYGECSLAVAVPMEWDDVRTLAGLRQRMAGGQQLRIATKYNHTVERFFEKNDLANIRIVYKDGALEAAPNVGYADFIADITSTGTTLRENNLRPLEDGTIIQSQATFIGNRESLVSKPDVLTVTEQMLEFIAAYLRAKNQYMIFANMRGESMQDVGNRILNQPALGGLQHPTISPLMTGDSEYQWWSVNIVVAQANLYTAVQQIRKVGGSGVVVTPVSYIFEERPQRIQDLLETLNMEKNQA